MTGWSEVAKLADLPPGSALEVIHRGRTYALFRRGDRVFAVDGLCPHQGGHLARGPVAETEFGAVVTCPRRGCLRWRFDLDSGEGRGGGTARVGVLGVRVEGESIFVAWPAP